MRLHVVGVPAQNGFESLQVGEAAEFRKALHSLPLGGQALRLIVGDHLQAVLDGAQEAVGLGKLVARLPGNPSLVMKRGEHLERAPPAQAGATAAEDELLRLHEKLDLPDA